jgi:hypothetical protein
MDRDPSPPHPFLEIGLGGVALPEFREVPLSTHMDSHAETESAADLARRLGLRFSNLHLLVRA